MEKSPPYVKDWLDVYAAYDTAHQDADPYALDSNKFNPGRLTVQSLDEKTWQPTANIDSPVNLFDKDIVLTNHLSKLKFDRFADIDPIETWTLQSKNGFLRLRLADGDPRSDFLHDEYPTVLARQMLAAATITRTPEGKRQAIIGAFYRKQDGTYTKPDENASVELTDEAIIPKEPYLPVIQSFYHKGRAVTIFDYERLVLEKFPDIYKS